jgi:murein DD-endopeptidase MepM/ murein hydrolase activator NlpD
MIVLTRGRRIQRARHVGGPAIVFAGAVLASLVAGAFWLGASHAPFATRSGVEIDPASMRQELSVQRATVRRAVGDARHDLDALALRLSELQARAIRLDALGGRLVEMTGMDAAEFGFDRPPARGGAAPAGGGEANQVPDFISALEGLEKRLELRGQELAALESALLSGRVAEELKPAGRPLVNGWISSTFGRRTDPMTGQRSMHQGIDFAGQRGSPIQALAGGVVVFSGVRSGLGRVVEIDHGNGYVTRYAHNLKNLVKVGQRVAKGEHIARLGSSGRSTGNHVHLEILRHGRAVNPMPFVRASKARSPS